MWSADLNPDGIVPGSLCIAHDAAWWVSASGVLYTWRAGPSDDEPTDPVAVAQLDRRVETMAVSLDASRIVVVSSTYMAILQIECTASPEFMYRGGEESPDDGMEPRLTITANELVRVACTAGDVRRVVFNSDASLAAVCTDTALLLLSDIPGSAMEYEALGIKPRVTGFHCIRLGASTQGCSLACFTGTERLLIVDDVNHLLLLQRDRTAEEENETSMYTSAHTPGSSIESLPAVRLERIVDGHICTRTSRVTSLTCSHSGVYGESVVVVGILTGTVQVLNGRTLQPLRTWSVQGAINAALLRSSDVATATGSRARGRSSQIALPDRLGIPDAVVPPDAAVTATVFDVCVGACLIMVCTSHGVLYYSRLTFQVESTYTQLLTGPRSVMERTSAGASAEASAATSIVMQGGANGRWAWINVFEGVLFFSPCDVDTRHMLETRMAEADVATEDIVHAGTPLPSAWLGRASKPSSGTKNTIARSGAQVGQKSLFSAPVPHRRSVKGSGYADAPWSVQQERKLKAKAAAARDRKAQAFGAVSALAVKSANVLRFEYNFDEIFGTGHSSLARKETATAALCGLHGRLVTAATFSSLGDALITVGGDGGIQHLHFPIASAKGTGGLAGRILGGHNAAVTAVDTNLSRQNSVILSAGADGLVRVWSPGTKDIPIAECSVNGGSARGAGGPSANSVVAAQFFYLDKFVMTCGADTLELRRYDGGGTKYTAEGDDPGYVLSRAPVFTYSVGNRHSITTATSVNHFCTNMVFLATSEKEVQLLDVVANTVLWREKTTHTRGIYRVATDRTSRYCTAEVSSASAHLFMSASLDSTAALWDIRVAKPVQLFTQHSNTGVSSLALEFCPGIGAVAVASQDNGVYMYDLRGGGGAIALEVLRGFDTYVTSLAWHPLRPFLAAGLANGDVHIFHSAP